MSRPSQLCSLCFSFDESSFAHLSAFFTSGSDPIGSYTPWHPRAGSPSLAPRHNAACCPNHTSNLVSEKHRRFASRFPSFRRPAVVALGPPRTALRRWMGRLVASPSGQRRLRQQSVHLTLLVQREKPAAGEWCFSPALVLVISGVSCVELRRAPFLVSRRVWARVAL